MMTQNARRFAVLTLIVALCALPTSWWSAVDPFRIDAARLRLALTAIALVAILLILKAAVPIVRNIGRYSGPLSIKVGSPSEALSCAESLLQATTAPMPRLAGVPSHVDHDGIWRACAQMPLAGLVFAAARQSTIEAVDWLVRTLELLCEDGSAAAWASAVDAASDVDSLAGQWVGRAAGMERRQRASVAVVMRDAVAQYAGALR